MSKARAPVYMTREEVSQLFSTQPAAINLVDDIFSYYLSRVKIKHPASDIIRSTYCINFNVEKLIFNSADITLAQSHRVRASLAHELLHIRRPMLGFPTLRNVDMRNIRPGYDSEATLTIGDITNVIEHDSFFDDFVSLGFDGGDFLRAPDEIPSYEQEARRVPYASAPRDLQWIVKKWWASEFLRHEITERHGRVGSSAIALEVEKWGMQAVPNFDRTTLEIRDWISAGDHKYPSTFQMSIRNILEICSLPKSFNFALLQKPSPATFRMIVV